VRTGIVHDHVVEYHVIVAAAFDSVESRQNPRFKLWLNYSRHPEEKTCPWVPVEGSKQIRELSASQDIQLLLFSGPEDRTLDELAARAADAVRVPPKLLESISNVKSPQTMLAFFSKPHWDWDQIGGWVVYLQRLQDPGNLGTLFRTAAATGMFSLVCSPGTVSCFNSKVVRASSSSLFVVPCLEGIELSELKKRGYKITSTGSKAGVELYRALPSPPNAIVIGNEGAGIEQETKELADECLVIPMKKGTESLNASVAGSIIMYEIYRQKMYT
jgi:TrmH family RNA methyltransferase